MMRILCTLLVAAAVAGCDSTRLLEAESDPDGADMSTDRTMEASALQAATGPDEQVSTLIADVVERSLPTVNSAAAAAIGRALSEFTAAMTMRRFAGAVHALQVVRRELDREEGADPELESIRLSIEQVEALMASQRTLNDSPPSGPQS